MRLFLVLALIVAAGCESPTRPIPSSPVSGASGNVDLPTTTVDGRQRAYELTFVADGEACQDLPVEVRRRSYTGTPSAGSPLVHLGGATFVRSGDPLPTWNVIYAKWSNAYTDTSAADGFWFHDPPIWEALSDDSYLVIYGSAESRIAGDYASVPFWARFEYCPKRELGPQPACQVPLTTCFSQNHRLAMRVK